MRGRSKFPQHHVHHHTHLMAVAILAAAFLFSAPATRADTPDLMAPAPASIPAPAIDLPALDGPAFSLAGRKGRFTLVNFWALWCAPCREEMPSLARLKSAMAGRGLEVVAVNLGDKPDAVARFLKRTGTQGLAVVLDKTGEAGRAWHVEGLPATFLVGPDGTVTHAALGARDWSAEGARRWFERTLSNAGGPAFR